MPVSVIKAVMKKYSRCFSFRDGKYCIRAFHGSFPPVFCSFKMFSSEPLKQLRIAEQKGKICAVDVGQS